MWKKNLGKEEGVSDKPFLPNNTQQQSGLPSRHPACMIRACTHHRPCSHSPLCKNPFADRAPPKACPPRVLHTPSPQRSVTWQLLERCFLTFRPFPQSRLLRWQRPGESGHSSSFGLNDYQVRCIASFEHIDVPQQRCCIYGDLATSESAQLADAPRVKVIATRVGPHFGAGGGSGHLAMRQEPCEHAKWLSHFTGPFLAQQNPFRRTLTHGFDYTPTGLVVGLILTPPPARV